MHTSKELYKELAIPYFKEVFQVIDEVLRDHNVPYYLIGASAMALEMLKLKAKPSRGTRDIDFAVMVSSVEEYDSIVGSLLMNGFNETGDQWRIIHQTYNTVIDLLPFGTIEEKYTEDFDEREIELHVLGMNEVLEDSIKVEIDEYIAKIPPLHGMLILKFISWSDRPEHRYNDPYDILQIIEKYFDMYSDEIYEQHNDLFDQDEFDQLKISSRVLGRKAASILMKSEKLKERILNVLEDNIQTPAESVIAIRWAKDHNWEVEYAIKLLEELKLGIIETIDKK